MVRNMGELSGSCVEADMLCDRVGGRIQNGRAAAALHHNQNNDTGQVRDRLTVQLVKDVTSLQMLLM